ncbi:AAA family ATPase [Streptomyces sp. NPDC001508]|uniref:helix-turn-helix transcriptional regulator n=1 Tax=Streptomyces sp. NPDC001508 TaxID=3154656 RepID=UPI0033304A0F
MLDFLSRARDGEGQSLLIEAAVGMGRSSMLRAVGKAAPGFGLRVLTARARASEQNVEYGVAHQLMAKLGDTRGTDGPPGRPGRLSCPFPNEDLTSADADLHPLMRVLANDVPVLLAIDDLQWMDLSSLRCLGYLMARLESASVALVATLALGEAPANSLMTEVLSGFQHRVVLAGLTTDEAALLSTDTLGAPAKPETLEAAVDATGGSPYLLNALFRALRLNNLRPCDITPQDIASQGPVEVAETLLNRYERAWPGAETTAEATAVLGGAASVAAIARLTGSEELEVADTVASLGRAGLLAQDADTVRFTQPMVCASVLARLPPSRRNALHIRAAHVLYETGAPHEQIATQILRSYNDAAEHWTCSVLSEAAREAVGRGAYEVARDYLIRGLEECEGRCQGKLLRVLGQIELSTDPATAAEYLRKALALSPDPAERIDIQIDLIHCLYILDQPHEAKEILEKGLAESSSSDPTGGPRLWGEQFVLGVLAGRETGQDSLGRGPETVSAGSVDPLDHRLRLDLASMLACCRGEAREEAVQQAERSLRRPYTGLNERLAARTVPIQVLTTADELDSALSESDALVEQAKGARSRTLGALAHSMRAEVHIRIGNVPKALEDAYCALKLMPLSSFEYWVCTGQAMAAGVGALVETAQFEEAHRLLARAGLEHQMPDRSSFGPLLFHRAQLRMADDDVEGSLADLMECGAQLAKSGTVNPAVLTWRSDAALAYAELGDRQEARRLIDTELSRARRWGAPRAIGRALRAAGLLAKGRKGEAMLGDAAQVLESSPARLDLARVLADLGILARRSHRLQDAREYLRRSLSLAEICGATKLAQTVREELLVSGARPRRPTEVGIDALTPTERRVALLAVSKRTNREIAASLFVAQRTVELHLSAVYRKLSIPGRSGLADYFGELPNDPSERLGKEQPEEARAEAGPAAHPDNGTTARPASSTAMVRSRLVIPRGLSASTGRLW